MKASYDDIIKPALELCMKGTDSQDILFPQIQRKPALTVKSELILS